MPVRRPRLLLADRHLLATMLPRMGLALAVVLAALVIERILRLFDFATQHGAALAPVLQMVVNLLPHYVGLALPMAFCLGVLGALGRLSANSEIEALEGAGWSLRRIGLPFILCGAVFALLSVGLFGWVQPHARYAYHAERDQVATAGWQGRLEARIFVDIGSGLALSSESVGRDGRTLGNVILLQETAQGLIATTAEEGLVQTDASGTGLKLILEDTRSLTPNGSTLRVARVQVDHDLTAGQGAFRPRGQSARELTLAELWNAVRSGDTADPAEAVEFHDRLVRAVSLLGVACLAVPLGVTRKRSPLWPRIAVAVVALALYDNLVKFVGGLGALGEVPAAQALWGLAFAFNGTALALYLATPSQGGRGPFTWRPRQRDRAPLPIGATTPVHAAGSGV